MNFNGFEYLNACAQNWKTRKTAANGKLERMQRALALLGNPHKGIFTLHTAGSKGKGSTCLFLAKTLELLGYKTLLFLSPHVYSIKERATLAGTPLDDALWHRSLAEIERLSRKSQLNFTYFEVLTLCAFLMAKTLKADRLVLETGLGGRLDATNLCQSGACLITPIELEHTGILGASLQEIAAEKAGIIKKSVPVFCAKQKSAALKVIKRTAAARSAPLFYLPDFAKKFKTSLLNEPLSMQARFIYNKKPLQQQLALLGQKQAENAALALLCLEKTEKLPALEAWRLAAAQTRLPARMEIIQARPLLAIDGAHTAASVKEAVSVFLALAGRSKESALIFGCAQDKNAQAMAKHFKRFAQVAIACPDNGLCNAKELCRTVLKQRPDALAAACAAEALARFNGRYNILVLGSFYLAGEIKEALRLGQASSNSSM